MSRNSTTTSKKLWLRLGSSGDLNNLARGDIVLLGTPHRGKTGEIILRGFIVSYSEEHKQFELVDASTTALVAASPEKYKAALNAVLWNDEDERKARAAA